MLSVIVCLTFFGLLIVVICVAYEKGEEFNRIKESKHYEDTHKHNTVKYFLDKNKAEYDVLIKSFDDKLKKFSQNINFNSIIFDEFGKWTQGTLVTSHIEDIIKQKSLTKISYHDEAFYVNCGEHEFKILSICRDSCDTGFCKSCQGYVSGSWDDDMKSIFMELYKKALQREIDWKNYQIESAKKILNNDNITVDTANEFYKNN